MRDPNRPDSAMAVLQVEWSAARPRLGQSLRQHSALLSTMLNRAKPVFVYEEHLARLRIVHAVGREAFSRLGVTDVLDALLRLTTRTLGFDFAVAHLVNEVNGIIKAECGVGVSGGHLRAAVHALDSEHMMADLVRAGTLQVIDRDDDRFRTSGWKRSDLQDAVRVFAPICTGDRANGDRRVIGIVEAGYRQGRSIDLRREQQEMLVELVDQAALAIEKARLLQQTQWRADALASLHRAGKNISGATDLYRALKEIGQGAEQLHDSISQYLTAIHLMADSAIRSVVERPAEAARWMLQVQEAAEGALKELRYNLFRLQSMAPDEGLAKAIRRCVRITGECYAIRIPTHIDVTSPLPPAIEEAAFLTLREAISNSARHARAESARGARGARRRHPVLGARRRVGVRQGRSEPPQPSRLTAMAGRITSLGGWFDVQTSPGKGTLVRGSIPLEGLVNEPTAS